MKYLTEAYLAYYDENNIVIWLENNIITIEKIRQKELKYHNRIFSIHLETLYAALSIDIRNQYVLGK